jgi:hypothetical protein
MARRQIRVTAMRAWISALVLLALTAGVAPAQQPQGYRWVDELGNVGYAGRRDQVPERYRGQLPPERTVDPARSKVGSAPAERSVGRPVSAECVLRFRGTERRQGASQSFPDCDACNKALRALGGEDANRAECVATSVESYR